MISDKNPRDIEGWKSPEYVRWVRNNASCMACGEPLTKEKDDYISHHHRHHRGLDLALVPLCLRDHNALHFSAASKDALYRRYGLTDESFDMMQLITAVRWLYQQGKYNQLVNGLTEIARSIQEG